MTEATALGLHRSFGFGDRLGVATPGHMEAARGTGFLPVFAQQSIRELARTQRTPQDVMAAAVGALEREGWEGPWGADADHLQTQEDVARMAAAGFRMFTIDPSAHVNRDADDLEGDALTAAFDALEAAVRQPALDLYEGRSFDVEGLRLSFSDGVCLRRAAVKYGRALAYSAALGVEVGRAMGTRAYELEVSVDETPRATSLLEHLYIGLELKRLGVSVVSVAPRFVGDFEKGVDYKGDLAEFERQYAGHVAIARHCGPYKISIHSGSDKFAIYPTIGRLSGELLHVKTAGTSYLEALRVVCRCDRALFREIAAYCRGRYENDRASYHVSARVDDVAERIEDADIERVYLDEDAGRQVLHVTFGAVLTEGRTSTGALFRDRILETLGSHADLYREVLRSHLGKHLRLLAAG